MNGFMRVMISLISNSLDRFPLDLYPPCFYLNEDSPFPLLFLLSRVARLSHSQTHDHLLEEKISLVDTDKEQMQRTMNR